MMITTHATTDRPTPYRIMVPMGTWPELYAIAFGGVEIGSMKQTLAPSVAPSAGSIGLMPAARLTAMAMGTTMLADAVFDVISESPAAKHVNRMVNGRG